MFRQVLRQGSRAARRAGQACKEASRASSGATYMAASKASTYAGAAAAAKGGSSAAAAFGLVASLALTPVALADGNDQRTYIMIKPDGVHRGLIADIIKRFEQKGYKLVGIKVIVPSKEIASEHYTEHNGKPFFPKLVNFLSSGAVIAMVWEGKDVIKYGRTLIGTTNPLASAPGTIRGDYGVDVGRNIVHGSDSVESAQREIALWFKAEELADYALHSAKWIYE